MALETCATEQRKNLGKSKCTKIPKLFKRCIETPAGWFLEPADYATAAALKTKLQALLTNPINTRGYLFPPFSGAPENQSEESLYEDTPFGRVPVRDGQYRFKHAIAHNLCTHIALQSHRCINERGILYLDVDNQLLFTEPDGDGKLYPLSLALLWTEKLMLSDGTNSTKSPFIVDLADNEQIDKYGVIIDGSVVNQLEPLTDASITLTAGDAFAAAEFNVDVKQTCDGVPISGLLLADFLVYQADGITPQALSSATEDANNPGRYNLNGTGDFVTGMVKLRAPSALTIKAYELSEPLDFVIA
jgi:hypothetical protein